jgi:hypothetical protein
MLYIHDMIECYRHIYIYIVIVGIHVCMMLWVHVVWFSFPTIFEQNSRKRNDEHMCVDARLRKKKKYDD